MTTAADLRRLADDIETILNWADTITLPSIDSADAEALVRLVGAEKAHDFWDGLLDLSGAAGQIAEELSRAEEDYELDPDWLRLER